MQIQSETRTRRGIVVSDMHLFARRSRGFDCWRSLLGGLKHADVVILNGDTFDFRWSKLDRKSTVSAALDWLQELPHTSPQRRIHYVLGNHDCLRLFQEGLEELSANTPNLAWHDPVLRLGSALFLHGDCAGTKMDGAGLRRYRAAWEEDRSKGMLATSIYMAADRLGITDFVHARAFPRAETVGRIAYYLDATMPGWRDSVRDCYFGHTHLPFSDHLHDGVVFHNTGSAIRAMDFSPMRFDITGEDALDRAKSAPNAITTC